MAGNSWSITIVKGSPCTFEPDVYCPPGQPKPKALTAETGDLISWNNQTGQAHEIWGTVDTDAPAQLTGSIPPKGSSSGYSPQPLDPPKPYTVSYYCKLHTGETGTIEVVS